MTYSDGKVSQWLWTAYNSLGHSWKDCQSYWRLYFSICGLQKASFKSIVLQGNSFEVFNKGWGVQTWANSYNISLQIAKYIKLFSQIVIPLWLILTKMFSRNLIISKISSFSYLSLVHQLTQGFKVVPPRFQEACHLESKLTKQILDCIRWTWLCLKLKPGLSVQVREGKIKN